MKNKAIKIVVFSLLFLSCLNGIAQSGPGTGADETGGMAALEDTNSDAAAGPINDFIVPMLLLGAVLGFSLLKKNTKVAR